jgi:hypothetical protein
VDLKKDTQAFLDVSARLLAAGCRVRFRASGLSMHPSIRDGEMLDVERVELTSVQPGDVLLYRNEQRPIAHRVVQIYRTGGAISGLLLRGDAKSACDAPIEPHQVIGRVIVSEKSLDPHWPPKPWQRWRDYLRSCFGDLRNHPLAPRTIRQT